VNDSLKTFSIDLADKLKAAFSSAQVEDFVKQTKASGDDRSFEVVMSTSDEDRQGDELDQSRWDLKYYTMNPVVLWAHNYQGFPIGIVTDIEIKGNEAVATGKFAPQGVNAEADIACALYQAKVLRAVSPGYIQNDDGTRELLEVSFCPVPAGRYALSMRQVSELGMSTRDLVTKGFFYDTKGTVPYKSHGIAGPDTAWDGPAEVKACGEDVDKLKSICAWFDSADADVKSSYKLPHHRASDLKAVWNGVKAAGAALQGGRGGVDIPSGDLAGVKAHIASHYKEFGKTPPWEEKSEQKSPQLGDHCELDDGTPGVLAEDQDNPGEMVCVPSKSTKSESMNHELDKTFKAEHERHKGVFAKAIDEFEKALPKDGDEEEKSAAHKKAIDEFDKSIDGEQDEHLEKTMKAIDEGYELQDQKPAKAIDEFKSEMKAEHLRHVKAIDKSIDEFKSGLDAADGDDDQKKAIDEFTKSAQDELDRHEEAHKTMCDAEFGKGDEDEEKDMKAFIAAVKSVATGKLIDTEMDVIFKAGRAISAANKAKMDVVVKAIDDHHTEHGKHTDEITAALKAIMASGDGGEEPPNGDEPDRKALNSRSSTSGAGADLEAYLFGQRLVRQVKTVSEDALRQFKLQIRQARPSGR
jgi:tetratricopeptide (TPR) repeat protein